MYTCIHTHTCTLTHLLLLLLIQRVCLQLCYVICTTASQQKQRSSLLFCC